MLTCCMRIGSQSSRLGSRSIAINGMWLAHAVASSGAPTRRWREPDVVVLDRSVPKEQVIHHPSRAIFEALRSKDLGKRANEKFEDYLVMGVPSIWAVNPETGVFMRYRDGRLRGRRRNSNSTTCNSASMSSGRWWRRACCYRSATAICCSERRLTMVWLLDSC